MNPKQSKPLPRWLRMSLLLGAATLTPFLFIASCQSKLIYYPRPYPPHTVEGWQKRTHGKPIDFTSTMDMSRLLIGVPLGFLVTHRYDNTARLDELIARGPTHITILHGTHDEVIPVQMSRTLAQGREQSVKLIEIQGALHNNIADSHPKALIQALRECGDSVQSPSP